jgi:hypothetical protein
LFQLLQGIAVEACSLRFGIGILKIGHDPEAEKGSGGSGFPKT